MKVLIKNLDGTVGILHPILDCGLTLDEIIAKDVPKGVPYEIVDDSAIPADREFRNAWKHDLSVDIAKAQEITKERLRKERAPLLADLDVEFLKALETGADTSAILEQKQTLRDLPQKVDTITSLDDLKAIKA